MQLPFELHQIIQNEQYTIDDIGLSAAKVIIMDHYVLKIQEHQQEVVSIMKQLQDLLPIPQVIYYQDPYLLMSKCEGNMSFKYLDQIDELLPLLSEALKKLWSIDVSNLELPNRLEEKKQKAIANIQDHYYGFNTKEELIAYIQNYQDELVLSHGDFCLPNIIIHDPFSYIDLDQLGLNSKWCDIAICLRSLKYNLEGRYGGKVYPYYDVDQLLKELGIEKDEEAIRYHLILDELI